MTDDSRKIMNSVNLDPSRSAYAAKKTKQSPEAAAADDFAQMLVSQLESQTSSASVNNEKPAVDMAAFRQLEKLIDIQNKISSTEGSAGGDVTSMASFLGSDVKLKSQTVNVKDGDGGSLSFRLDEDAASVEVALLDAAGKVVDSFNAGALEAGEQTVDLRDLKTADGSYDLRVTAHGTSGLVATPEAFASGTVVGYRPGIDPTLIVGDREYSLSDILEVQLPKKA